MYGIVVMSVITRQQGKTFSKDIQTLFTEMYSIFVISVITSQKGKEISKNI